MNEPAHCYLNGQFCPIEKASLPISDIGFIHGVTVTEQLRTLERDPFLLTQHLDRFDKGLNLLDFKIRETRQDIESIVRELVARFLQEKAADDCGIGLFATPGNTGRFGQEANGPFFCVYCYELPFSEYKCHYEKGFRLQISSILDVDAKSFPKHVKIRSRLHYYLADLEARNSGSVALLADGDGYLRDTSIAAPIFVFAENTLTAPPADEILPSVSLEFALRLGTKLGFQIERRRIAQAELVELKSMALANSLFCLASVTEIESQKLETGSEIRSLIKAWKKESGVDYELQASECQARSGDC